MEDSIKVMKISINSDDGMPRLREGLIRLGHDIVDNVWTADEVVGKKVDIVIVAFSSMFHKKKKFIPLSFRLKELGIPLVTWNQDSPWNIKPRNGWRLNLILLLRMVSVYATHSLQDTEWIKGVKVIYLPNAAWTSRYGLQDKTISELMEKKSYDWDISFIGNLNAEKFPEHSARVRFIEGLSMILDKYNVKYSFIDSFKEKTCSVPEQIALIQNTKINLSCTAAVDSTGVRSWGLTERAYGIPACGGFLLMEERKHAIDDFDLKNEIALYDGSIEDCCAKILYYLEHEDERKRILSNAYQRVMRDHTYTERARTLLDAAGFNQGD